MIKKNLALFALILLFVPYAIFARNILTPITNWFDTPRNFLGITFTWRPFFLTLFIGAAIISIVTAFVFTPAFGVFCFFVALALALVLLV